MLSDIEKESDGPCKFKDPEAYEENPDFSQPAVEHEIISFAPHIEPPSEEISDGAPNTARGNAAIIFVLPASGYSLPETYPAAYPASPAFSSVQEPDDQMNPPITPSVLVYNTQNSQPNDADGAKLPVY